MTRLVPLLMKATNRPSGVIAGQSQMELVGTVPVRSPLARTLVPVCASQTRMQVLVMVAPFALATNATKRPSGVITGLCASAVALTGTAAFVLTVSVKPEPTL